MIVSSYDQTFAEFRLLLLVVTTVQKSSGHVSYGGTPCFCFDNCKQVIIRFRRADLLLEISSCQQKGRVLNNAVKQVHRVTCPK